MAYIELKDLEAYKAAREYSKIAWEVYSSFGWQVKKVIGDQMIRSVDSVGANIAEGYGRFHYLDKNKFYYNARGSLLETKHWFGLMFERGLITEDQWQKTKEISKNISILLNKLIKSQFKQKSIEMK